MKSFLHLCKTFWGNNYAQLIFRTLYYLLILLALLWIYGLNASTPPSHFIYTDF